jgi:DNA sulfur modification protein DndE
MALFKTSLEAKNCFEALRRSTGMRPNFWARVALCYSLSLPNAPDDSEWDSGGQEFPREVFFGKDEPVLLALIRQRHCTHLHEESELSRLAKLHVERGVRFLASEYERMNRRGDEFVLSVLRLLETPTTVPRPGGAPAPVLNGANFELAVSVGTDLKTGEPITYSLNAPGHSPHIAVMGRTRSGKTRTGLALLSTLSAQSRQGLTCLVFDYAKGDIASNQDFVRHMEANVIRVPDAVIPHVPLGLESDDEKNIKLKARRFVDTVKAVVRIGPKQSDACLKIVKEAYSRASGGELGAFAGLEDVHSTEDAKGGQEYYRSQRKPGVDLRDILGVAEEFYAAQGLKPDSLLAALREFCEFPLFAPVGRTIRDGLFDRNHVIDLSRVPDSLRKLAVFLALDSVYARIMNEPDSPLDERGFRRMKLLIVIDEAHNYLECRQPTLEKLIRESGSKGVGIVLLSQSPDDFDQPKYNFAREMGLTVVFSCVVERPRMLEALLGGDVDPQKLSQLPAGIALTRIPGSPRPAEVRIWK